MIGTLEIGEVHPASHSAMEYLRGVMGDFKRLALLQEVLASTALSGNRMAELCSETLHRLVAGEGVSDRYLLGLAWFVRDMETPPGMAEMSAENGRLRAGLDRLHRLRLHMRECDDCGDGEPCEVQEALWDACIVTVDTIYGKPENNGQ